MSREAHVRFCERLGVKLPRSTHPVAESFFATLKLELVYHTRFKTRQEAASMTFDYIEVFYNRQRLHSTLGYLSPVLFETSTTSGAGAA